ncbi:type II toxin-antitoxin system Phd/YefM family antitoxin [Dethiothermospora halolimnae]|uniref:type II toxin-antitoxin system Phd/YefM family antitoxin n=1 Tax=Dethiothermospora halolimnae TaxID=3114390 RepID=UPI003CCC17A5
MPMIYNNLEKVESRVSPINDGFRDILKRIIPISELTRGSGSKIISKAKEEKEPYIIVKHNKPQAVLLSIEDFEELMEIKENYGLLQLAIKRLEKNNSANEKSFEDILLDENISKNELDKLTEEVEIE